APRPPRRSRPRMFHACSRAVRRELGRRQARSRRRPARAEILTFEVEDVVEAGAAEAGAEAPCRTRTIRALAILPNVQAGAVDHGSPLGNVDSEARRAEHAAPRSTPAITPARPSCIVPV